jgi:hypothetical protein
LAEPTALYSGSVETATLDLKQCCFPQRASIILYVYRVSLTIHDLTVLRGRHVDARTAFGVRKFDGLRHIVGTCRARRPSRASERGLPARNRGVSQVNEH